MNAENLLQELKSQGVSFRIESGRLCYTVPGGLCEAGGVIERITQNKSSLAQAVAAETGQTEAHPSTAEVLALRQQLLDALESLPAMGSPVRNKTPHAAFMG